MAQYIDKAAIVAEIERLEGLNNCGTSDFIEAKGIAFEQVKQALNTLEVKEADLNAADEQKQQLIDKCKEFCNRQTVGEYYNRRGVFQIDKYIDDMLNFIKGE